MGYLITDYENTVREFLQDTGNTNTNKMNEDCTIQVVGGNGSRTVFTLSKTNIVGGTSGVYYDLNQAGYTNSGISSVDANNGWVTFASAPSLSGTVPTSLFIQYYYQEFLTSDIDTFVNFGLGAINTPPMTGSNNQTTYQNLSQPQFNVVCLYGTFQGYYALAKKYAKQVNTTAEGKSSGKDAISKQFLALAKEYYDMAEKERLAINGPRQGRSTLPASAITNQNRRTGITNYGGFR
jgi:hypothetical protein